MSSLLPPTAPDWPWASRQQSTARPVCSAGGFGMPGEWLRGWTGASPAVLAGLCLAVLPGALAAARGLSPGNPDTVPVPRPLELHARSGPVAEARTELKAFATAPFPYDGKVPRTNARFLDTVMD